MDKKLLEEFWQDTIKMVEEAIRITKGSGLQNDQTMIDYIDKLNKLSVEF